MVRSRSQIIYTGVITNRLIDTGYNAAGEEIDENGNVIEKRAKKSKKGMLT